MVVLSPAYGRQAGRSQEHPGQTPEIDRPVTGMAACAFSAQHRNRAGDDAGEPEQDVKAYEGEKGRVGGRNFDPGDIGDSVAHKNFPLAAARYPPTLEACSKVTYSCS